MKTLKIAAAALALTLACASQALAQAQAYPNKPIRLVVPWPPGQATDLAARIVGIKISESLGQPVVVDNRAGAGGTLGTDSASKAAPDGYTLLAGSSGPVSISPLLQTVPYDPAKAFAPVSLIATVPYILVTHPSFPANNARELIGLLKANPGKYTFSSSGTGATGHLVGELFNATAGVQVLHIPYKGATPSLTDIMNGNVGYSFETLAAVVGPIKSGRLKALATSGARRSAALPDVPTVAESAGMPDFAMAAWIGYLMPAGTPPEVLARLSAEVQKAMQAPDLKERYLALGMDPVANTPEELGALMVRERERYSTIIKRANIKLEQ